MHDLSLWGSNRSPLGAFTCGSNQGSIGAMDARAGLKAGLMSWLPIAHSLPANRLLGWQPRLYSAMVSYGWPRLAAFNSANDPEGQLAPKEVVGEGPGSLGQSTDRRGRRDREGWLKMACGIKNEFPLGDQNEENSNKRS